MIDLLEKNIDKIDWYSLSSNSNAIHILEKYPNEIIWNELCRNTSAMNLLKNNQDKINWFILSTNPSIFEIDYSFFEKKTDIFREELIKNRMHPSRIIKYLNEGFDIEEVTELFL